MSCNFRVGQKVVCINDDNKQIGPPIPFPVTIHPNMDGLSKGTVYTIRDIFISPFNGATCIRLCEIRRRDYRCKGETAEGGYHYSRFRPLVEKKTDISIFTAMLTKKNLKVDA